MITDALIRRAGEEDETLVHEKCWGGSPLSQWRDVMCGEPRAEHVGRRLKLAGWVARRRDHGGLIFIDLRDRSGICQLVVNPERSPEAAEIAHGIRNEFVLQAEGEIVMRSPETVNAAMPTGKVELQVDQLEIVSTCPPLPFQLDEENIDETLRLRYAGSTAPSRDATQSASLGNGCLCDPEADGGARVHRLLHAVAHSRDAGGRTRFPRSGPTPTGEVLRSPAVAPALQTTSRDLGVDRYYQIATCFRDEDLRADRQFEFRQLDVEMAFADRGTCSTCWSKPWSRHSKQWVTSRPGRPFPR